MSYKRLLIAFLTVCAVLLTVGLLPVHGESEIYDTVVRLHVLANSDSEEDQANKLAVRDRILEVMSGELETCDSRSDAEKLVAEKSESLLQACRETLLQRGCEDAVSLTLSEEYYPTRHYEEISLPAGKYLSLQVQIGEAKGKNWWCVLYPPVCLGACSAKEKLADAGFDGEQVKLLSEEKEIRYAVKFKVLEAVGKFFGRLFD